MAFPDTAFEEQRVLVAASAGMTLDPRNTADLVIVILLSVIYGINLFAALFVLFNRKYPPIKSKVPLIMVAMYVSSVFWFIGDLAVDGHVTLVGSVLEHCRGFGFWLRILVGVCTITSLIAMRCYTYYLVFNKNIPARGLRYFLPLGIYYLCLIACGIVVSVLDPTKSVAYLPEIDLCNMAKPLKITMFVILWVTVALSGLISWKTRNIKSSFNEVREMFFTFFVILAALITNTAVQFAHPYYPISRKYRIVSTLFDAACVNVLWWGIMAKPVYNCLFKRQVYLQEWTDKLYQDGLQKEYEMTKYITEYALEETHTLETYKQPSHDPFYGTEVHSTHSRFSFSH
ncbi:hypothetical protein LPJ59_001258 [Coemansia sp. RSA 2399]|nr:hypothetical protein LPJ59_001258 [Coemansia sp. RSA 2399]